MLTWSVILWSEDTSMVLTVLNHVLIGCDVDLDICSVVMNVASDDVGSVPDIPSSVQSSVLTFEASVFLTSSGGLLEAGTSVEDDSEDDPLVLKEGWEVLDAVSSGAPAVVLI